MKLTNWIYSMVAVLIFSLVGCGGGGGGGGGTTPPPIDTTAPTVSITAPVNGAIVSGTLIVTASATDNVGGVSGVSKVEFFVNNVLATTDFSAPFNYSWNTALVPNGSYTLTAKAYDATNNSATSSIVTVTVNSAVSDTTAPNVSITAPTNGAIVSGSVNITADATDNVGVSKVEFYVTGSLAATVNSPPFSFNWNTLGASEGANTLTAKAYDSANNSTTSSAVVVTVKNAPTVSITSPTANTIASGTILVDASATDDVGVTKVELYVDSTLIGTSTIAPYSFNWNTTALTNGSTYTLTAKAYDAAGHVTTSAAVPVILREIRVRTQGSVSNISGIQLDINIPTGATPVPVPIPGSSPPDESYVTVTGVASAAGALATTNLAPPLRTVITSTNQFSTGDFMTINCTFASGSALLPTDFTIVPLSFSAFDGFGGTIGGVTAQIY